MGAETKRLLRLENAASAALDHVNVTLVEVKAVRGAASWPKLRINAGRNWRTPETSAGPYMNQGLANPPQP